MAEPARPTAEQEEWLKAEGFREEPEEQPDEDGEDGPPKVRQQPMVTLQYHTFGVLLSRTVGMQSSELNQGPDGTLGL